jgi:hypothetical protein
MAASGCVAQGAQAQRTRDPAGARACARTRSGGRRARARSRPARAFRRTVRAACIPTTRALHFPANFTRHGAPIRVRGPRKPSFAGDPAARGPGAAPESMAEARAAGRTGRVLLLLLAVGAAAGGAAAPAPPQAPPKPSGPAPPKSPPLPPPPPKSGSAPSPPKGAPAPPGSNATAKAAPPPGGPVNETCSAEGAPRRRRGARRARARRASPASGARAGPGDRSWLGCACPPPQPRHPPGGLPLGPPRPS